MGFREILLVWPEPDLTLIVDTCTYTLNTTVVTVHIRYMHSLCARHTVDDISP